MMRSAVVMALSAAVWLAGVPDACAQPGCQPTIMKPCAPPTPRPDADAADASKSNNTNKSNQTQDAPRRGIPVAPDTTFGVGAKGLGLNGKF
jgi:hypothetical protein